MHIPRIHITCIHLYSTQNCIFSTNNLYSPVSVSVSVQLWPIVSGIGHLHGIGLTLLQNSHVLSQSPLPDIEQNTLIPLFYMETINTVIVRHNYYKTETYEHYYIRQQRRIQSANMKSITRFCSQAFCRRNSN